MIEKRQVHKSILEVPTTGNAEAGFRTAVMDQVPEDSDVFYVLSRKPSFPNGLPRSYLYIG